MKPANNKLGFTLVEVIVVLVILAILAAILIPAYIGYIGKSEERICDVSKSQLQRDLTALEIYETQGKRKFTTQELQDRANTSEFHCLQGGVYTASRGSDGNIVIICSVHHSVYNFNMNEALNNLYHSNPEIQTLINNYASKGQTIDSTSGTGFAYEKITTALAQLGFNTTQSGVNTWSLHGKGHNQYYLYWTTEDITKMNIGDKVKVMRYNSARGTYTAGYVTVSQTTLSPQDSSDGQQKTYNVLSRNELDWQEYTDVQQSQEDKTNYNTIYEIFKKIN